MAAQKPVIGVIGARDTDEETLKAAHEVGARIAQNSATLVCGGLGGVMEAASRGAAENNGTVIGILPTDNRHDANPWVSVAIPTGMGIARNILIVRTADVLIAFPGSYGTLSEIGLALNHGKGVIAMPGTWDINKIGRVEAALFKQANDPAHALGLALNMVSHA